MQIFYSRKWSREQKSAGSPVYGYIQGGIPGTLPGKNNYWLNINLDLFFINSIYLKIYIIYRNFSESRFCRHFSIRKTRTTDEFTALHVGSFWRSHGNSESLCGVYQ